MSSATATVATKATKAKPTASKSTKTKDVETQNTVVEELAPTTTPDFGSDDDEGPAVTITAEAPAAAAPKKRGRKTNAEKAAAEAAASSDAIPDANAIGSVADALARFSTLESELQSLVEFLRKNKTALSKSEVNDLTKHHKKTNELHTRLSDSVVSTLTSTVGATAAAAAASASVKPPKGFKKDGQPRKKAEHKLVNIHPVLQKYMAEHNVIDALKAKDPEFSAAYDAREGDDKNRFTRTEVQQIFSHIIGEMKRAHPEETKSTAKRTKTEKDGSEVEVIDNTYYTVYGPDVTNFFVETSGIIKAEMDKGDASKYKDNIATLLSGSMVDSNGRIPNLISQKWHMSYLNFFILRE